MKSKVPLNVLVVSVVINVVLVIILIFALARVNSEGKITDKDITASALEAIERDSEYFHFIQTEIFSRYLEDRTFYKDLFTDEQRIAIGFEGLANVVEVDSYNEHDKYVALRAIARYCTLEEDQECKDWVVEKYEELNIAEIFTDEIDLVLDGKVQ